MTTAGRLRPLVMLLTGAVVFGGVLSINKIALDSGVPYLGYFFWYCLGGGLLSGVAALVAGRNPLPTSWRHLRAYVALALIGIVAPMGLMIYVADKLPPSIVGLVMLLTPPLTYLLALAVKLERFRWLSIAGIALGLAGVLVLTLPKTSLPEPGMLGWLLLALGAPLTFAIANIGLAMLRPPGTNSAQFASGILLAAALVLLPIAFAAGSLYGFPAANPTGNWAILAVVLCVAGYWWLMLEVVRLAGAVFFSFFNYPAVIASIVFAVLLFGDAPSAWLFLALALMAAGVALVSHAGRTRAAETARSGGDLGAGDGA